jgi:hypothetical protein
MNLSAARENARPTRQPIVGEGEKGCHFPLAKRDFAVQSNSMNPNWAEENLQTIRTLMERSAMYRRALAPIMLFAGTLGVLTTAVGLIRHWDSSRAFGALWLGTAVVAVTSAFFITRRQALKDKEPFWSPPTRRVTVALLPPLSAGMVLGVVFTLFPATGAVDFTLLLPFLWALFYGCALHAAGFFMPRGVKWFGWIYVGSACVILCILMTTQPQIDISAHWLMGFFFGVLHLAYGAYLYLTEKGKNAA